LRTLASDPRVIFDYRDHALVEMGNDDLYRIDVENMLRRCRVTLVEDIDGEETWRAEGTDIDGRPIAAVIVPYEETIEVKIITAWKRSK
jgi:hypothetical protein